MENGTVVRLKSGGPKMTIDYIDTENSVICKWFDTREPVLQVARFEATSLQEVKDE